MKKLLLSLVVLGMMGCAAADVYAMSSHTVTVYECVKPGCSHSSRGCDIRGFQEECFFRIWNDPSSHTIKHD